MHSTEISASRWTRDGMSVSKRVLSSAERSFGVRLLAAVLGAAMARLCRSRGREREIERRRFLHSFNRSSPCLVFCRTAQVQEQGRHSFPAVATLPQQQQQQRSLSPLSSTQSLIITDLITLITHHHPLILRVLSFSSLSRAASREPLSLQFHDGSLNSRGRRVPGGGV